MGGWTAAQAIASRAMLSAFRPQQRMAREHIRWLRPPSARRTPEPVATPSSKIKMSFVSPCLEGGGHLPDHVCTYPLLISANAHETPRIHRST